MKQILEKINIEKLIIVILIILMILPYSIDVLGIGISNIVTVLVCILFLYLIVTRRELIKKTLKNKFIIFNALFVIAIIFSLISNFDTIKFNDIYEPIRYIVFSIIAIMVMIICQKKDNYLFILKAINITTIIITIFGIIQYFNPFSINELYLDFYTSGSHYKTLVNDYGNPRIIGTKWTPPAWALLMSLCVYFNILNFKYNKNKVSSILAIILCVTNLMMTLTRTNQIAFMISIVIFILINVWVKRGWKKAIITMSVTILLILILLVSLPEQLTWRLMQITDLSEVNSWTERIDKWGEQLLLLKGDVLLGIGPIKNHTEIVGYTDSELVQMPLQYGIIGIVIYILMLCTPVYEYIKDKNLKNILLFYPSILVIILTHNISASSLVFFDTAIVIYIIIGLLFVKIEEKENEEKYDI